MRRAAKVTAFLFICLCGPWLTGQAQGAGFAIKEHSATALGNAFAGGTAGADDLSYMFFNPAAMARLSGNQAVAVGNFLAPHSNPTRVSGSTVLGTPIGGGDGGSDLADDAIVPALYGMLDFERGLKLGIGITAPWGLSTDYDDDWVGRYHARRSELTTVNINPALAYRVTDWLALGAGLQAQYIDVELTNALDFGTLGFIQTGGALGTPAQNDGNAKVTGDDWGFGFNLGGLVEPWPGTRFGASYRSKVSHNLEGKATFGLDRQGMAATLQSIAAGAGQAVPFVTTGAEASTDLPEIVSFGIHQDLGAGWAIMGEAAWTRWSRFDELRIRFTNPAQPDSVTEEGWDDSWFLAGGVTYRLDDNWIFRAGIAYDQTPIPDGNRTPRVPGDNRLWFAIGAGYEVSDDIKLDLSYTHILVDETTVDLSAGGIGNTFRGNLSGSFEDSRIDILGVQLRAKF